MVREPQEKKLSPPPRDIYNLRVVTSALLIYWVEIFDGGGVGHRNSHSLDEMQYWKLVAVFLVALAALLAVTTAQFGRGYGGGGQGGFGQGGYGQGGYGQGGYGGNGGFGGGFGQGGGGGFGQGGNRPGGGGGFGQGGFGQGGWGRG